MIHSVKHYYQPTNTSCGPTAASILLSHYNQEIVPKDAIKQIPVVRSAEGEDMGTAGQHIAQWFNSLGYKVDLYSADFQTLDLTWRDNKSDELLKCLEEIKDIRDIPAMGKVWSKIYVEGYINFIKAGGKLHIQQYISSKLLDSLLVKGPVMTTVNYNVLYNSGRTKTVGHITTDSDPINGRLMNHFNVLTGIKDGKYVISDPWKKPGHHEVEKELFIASIQAAQMECDNLVIQIEPKVKQNETI